nr:EOG090X0GIP [Lepidurus arcticus]
MAHQEERYSQTTSQVEDFDQQTENLVKKTPSCGADRLERSDKQGIESLESYITEQLTQTSSLCQRIDILVNKEPPTRRREARQRLDQLQQDYHMVKVALQNIQRRRFQKEQEEKERDLLLNSTFQPNQRDTTLLIDYALKENSSLQNSHRGLDDMLHMGQSVLENMRSQRFTLKGAHKRFLDMTNTLGMSNTVMRLIERRGTQDKYIMYGGFFFVFLLIIFIMWCI